MVFPGGLFSRKLVAVTGLLFYRQLIVNYFLAVVCLIGTSFYLSAQPVNGYAKVTSVTGSTSLNLSNVNETYDTFEEGERIIIMQVQDDVIGTTSNTSSFGDLGAIQSAGLYETKVISTVTESGGVPTSITLSTPLVNTYNTCANCSVQIISYPVLDDGGGNFVTKNNITPVSWNGNVGGVIAFKVSGTLTIAHNISASASGFRGGGVNPTNDGSACQAGTYITNDNRYGYKGESIYKSNNTNYTYARGKLLNGGGGGNPHNSGGGGGGNFTAGGNGGPGYNCGASPAHGFGGLDLSDQISGDRVFFGGAGGGGQGNNSVATAGARGGGVAFITANTISTVSCSSYAITANGGTASQAGNDGGGGGGAGGSIVMNVSNWNLGCTLNITANGGNGGSVNNGNIHGGGGGGGKGVLIFSAAIGGVSNLNITNTQGVGGANQTGGSPSRADDGVNNPSSPTADADGIVETEDNPLPVELLYWRSKYENNEIVLEWSTASESNNHFFTIEKSTDGHQWEVMSYIEGNGTASEISYYRISRPTSNSEATYYRLSQTDFDGTTEFFQTIFVSPVSDKINLLVFPNPVTDAFHVSLPDEFTPYLLVVYDNQGKQLDLKVKKVGSQLEVDTHSLPDGMYIVSVSVGQFTRKFQLIKK